MKKGLLYLLFLCSGFIPALHFYSQNFTEDWFFKGEKAIENTKFDSAVYYFEKATSETERDSLLGQCYIKLSYAYKLNANYNQSLGALYKADSIYSILNLPEQKGQVYVALSEHFRMLKDFDKAFLYLDKFEKVLKTHSLPPLLIAQYYSRKAAIIIEGKGDLEGSLNYSLKVIEIAKELNNRELEATALNEIGFVYENLGNLKALDYYNAARVIWEDNKNYRALVNVLTNLGRFEHHNGDGDRAINALKKAIILCDKYGFTVVKRDIHLFLFYAYSKKEEHQLAVDEYMKYHAIVIMEKEAEWNRTLKEVDQKYDLQQQKNINNEERFRAELAEKDAESKTSQRNWFFGFAAALLLLLIVVSLLLVTIKKTNRQLANNLSQKEILFKEVHHRVKNNLTLLKSLLYLRALGSNDGDVKMILEECQSRIHSMAVVHQNLYNEKDVSLIPILPFVDQLLTDINASMSVNTTIVTEGDNPSVDMSKGIFIGLILNELATNSIKYAKPENGQLVISVSIKQEIDNIEILYFDNGMGLPEGVSFEEGAGFGFKLIKIMMDQLDSRMHYKKSKDGVLFKFLI